MSTNLDIAFNPDFDFIREFKSGNVGECENGSVRAVFSPFFEGLHDFFAQNAAVVVG